MAKLSVAWREAVPASTGVRQRPGVLLSKALSGGATPRAHVSLVPGIGQTPHHVQQIGSHPRVANGHDSTALVLDGVLGGVHFIGAREVRVDDDRCRVSPSLGVADAQLRLDAGE